jgi:flagellar hook-length control protein FliK
VPDVSILAVLPVAPTAATLSTPAAAPPPVAPGGPDLSFVTQLKSALASRAGVAMPRSIGPSDIDQQLPGEPAPAPADSADAPKLADHDHDNLPELLASLGYLVVPAAFQPRPNAQPNGGEASSDTVQAAPGSLETARARAAENAAELAPASDSAATGQFETAPQTASLAPVRPTVAHVDPTGGVSVGTVPLDSSAATAVETTSSAHTDVSAAHHEAGQIVAAMGTTGAAAQSAPHAGHQGTFGHSSDDRGTRDEHAARVASLTDTTTSGDHASTADQPFVALADGATTATVIPSATHARASEVVNQIAHQADLYRLPGNKGVRIQLHPENLGGVDVTLRYSAAGGIQLHISVEHAATGQLVQSGWTELRDALATQGISPDRLVISITGPKGANGLDFSSNDSGQPDHGLGSFTQGQSSAGQQRQNDDGAQAPARGWNPTLDQTSSLANDGARGASASSARIDYRV